MKKILILIGIPLAIIGSFLIGAKYQQTKNDNVYKASTTATNNFVDGIILSKLTYETTDQTYKNSIKKDDFDSVSSKLKEGKISGLYTLTSPVENQSYYKITTKDNKTLTLIVSAAKIKGNWTVTRTSLVE
jgi:uncharacterized protein YxeA